MSIDIFVEFNQVNAWEATNITETNKIIRFTWSSPLCICACQIKDYTSEYKSMKALYAYSHIVTALRFEY